MRSVSVPTQVARLRIPVAVAAVCPAAAQLVGLRVHHGVHGLLDEAPEQLLHFDGAVVEPGHGEHAQRRV